MASLPVVAVRTRMPRRSSTLLRAKMLRASSSTSSTLRPSRSSSEPCSRSSMRCFSGGRSDTSRCRKSAVSSRRRSGDSTPLTTMLRAIACSCASSSADSSRPVKTMTGMSARRVVLAHPLQDVEPAHVRQAQVEHHAIAPPLLEDRQRVGAAAGRDDVDVVVSEQLGDAEATRRGCPRRSAAACAAAC